MYDLYRWGLSFRHVDLEGGFSVLYRNDEIHPLDIGLDIFNADLQSCLEQAAVRGGDRWV